ncbi:ATP-binding protein [Amycolatopsis rhabdoformis]|uniref:ATP-binding protein n=1 Tax=Amycolatopsis rhabdoformis TaxID=1448059 RepID=A0ABZ1IHJ3_9PSEU|nr:ATP-binding protein [Amycolatopsis rhabdoformis]WSE33628.1 ATP-binding protein [Amycolatopsis rhabdoformis]
MTGPDDEPPPALHLHQAARVRDASTLRFALVGWARNCDLPPDLIADLELAAYEALINASEHAYAAGTTGTLDLRAHCDAGAVHVTVTDHGRWRPRPAPDPRRGRGLPLIHLLSDHAEVTPAPGGTTVAMTWRLPGGSRPS